MLTIEQFHRQQEKELSEFIKENRMTRPTLEDMNARKRRDGGEFKVYAWSEEIGCWLGTMKNDKSWYVAKWGKNGGYAYDSNSIESGSDLIEKPVVEEWMEPFRSSLYCTKEACVVDVHLEKHFRKENGVTKLVKVEVIND